MYERCADHVVEPTTKRPFATQARTSPPRVDVGAIAPSGRVNLCGDTTPCRMTGVTLHSHVQGDVWRDAHEMQWVSRL